jgi:hypothetical protein
MFIKILNEYKLEMPPFDRSFGKEEEENQPLEHISKRTEPQRRAFNVGDKILNHYDVKAVLGGGMGDVYIALDTDWNQLFAIKTFKDEYLGSEEAINRFMREAETWVDLERQFCSKNSKRIWQAIHLP